MSDLELRLAVSDPLAGPDRVDEVTTHLLADLRELGLRPRPANAAEGPPPGAKGDPLTVAAVVTAVIASPLLPKLVELAQAWVLDGRRRSVELTTEAGSVKLAGPTPEQQELVTQWLRANVEAAAAQPRLAAATAADEPADGAREDGDG